ncbi:protein kinase [Streptomyces sp. HUCO-GS316]|uniref:serine/threonine-protein kinase n=1 Tax=Streptomyces sp. HUCO-GS316 TaxID=2692198 RepID=UPI001367B76D|nr:serine/threonine-protein kinase [Streptomyces sp. HUCO-GS316]MXM63913.1 protein kinase [Streptomyces sp. HUCO-GS316]
MVLADRYQLEEPLGRGAVGEVWRATDQVLGRPVAVKILRAEETTDVARFRLEAQTAARLNHPGVVSVYDFGSHQGQLYLVMELVDGWSLAQERSLRGTLDPWEAAAIAAQVAAGLSAAHRQGVIHRDIKPANVMLTTDRVAKITDFGIARFTGDAAGALTATGKIVGSADYLAPERALGRPAQPASDVYSLGCVLYQLLTGQAPFQGATATAVVQQHVEATPVPPARLHPGIPQPLSDYVLHLLAKDPADRPSAEQTADRLSGQERAQPPVETDATAVLPAPPSAPPAPPWAAAADPVGSRPRGRRRPGSKALLGAAAVALFGAAAAIGASLNAGDDSPSPNVTSVPVETPGTAAPSAALPTTAPSAEDHEGDQGDGGDQDNEGKDGKGRHGRGGHFDD